MATGAEVARYWASLGVKVDTSDIRRVDSTLKQIEARLAQFKKRLEANKALTLDISKFHINQRELVRRLGDSLDKASRQVTFEVTKFVVDQHALNRTVQRGLNTSSRETSARVRSEPRGGSHALHAGIGGAMGAGIGRYYAPVAALAAGGYGLGALNRSNQAIQSAQLTTQAIVEQAGGTEEQGKQAFDWLRQQGNRVGFNYLESANDYNNLLSGLSGAGMTIKQGQDIFKGFSEYGRVNHIDTERQKRMFRALSQIAGKDQLMSEELTSQLAESVPGAVALFSAAYQRQTGQSLGIDQNLTGSDAIKALQKAMKDRKVTGSILPVAAQIASERAAPALSKSSQTAQAEQARFQNQTNDLMLLASQSGVEEGYARLFRTLNDGLRESGPLVKRLSEGFNEASKNARLLFLIPQSFQRMLEGRSSYLTNLIGEDDAQKIRESLKSITESWELLKASFKETGWMDFLKTTLNEVKMILGEVSRISAAAAGASRYKQYLQENGSSDFVASVKSAGKFLSTGRSETDYPSAYIREQERLYPLASDPNFSYYNPNNDPISLMNKVGSGSSNNTTNVTIGDVNITSTASNPVDFGLDVRNQVKEILSGSVKEAGLNYPRTGR